MSIAVVLRSRDLLGLLESQSRSAGVELVQCLSLKDAFLSGADAIVTEWPRDSSAGPLLDALRSAASMRPPKEVVIFVPRGDSDLARRALAAGARDVLFYPCDERELAAELGDLLGERQLLPAADRLMFERLRVSLLIGTSHAFVQALINLQRAAASDANVLVLGETGTGKEIFARAIHDLSRRAGEPFVAVNCAGIPGNLLESELFGHVRGAFTGADRSRDGRFAATKAGTLFLDEIGDLEFSLQSKLLRVVEARQFEKLGDNTTIPFHGRLVSATSVDLLTAIVAGRFRPDLMGRLNQFMIHLPPLRERRDDIPQLIHHFVDKHSRGRLIEISDSAAEILSGLEYPMNVRQLENAIVGAIARCAPALVILPRHLPPDLLADPAESKSQDTLSISIPWLRDASYQTMRDAAIRATDRTLLSRILADNRGNQSAAADQAGIDRKTFAVRLKANDLQD